jgi:hypothetical protein
MIDEDKRAAAKLAGLCTSKVRRWNEYAEKAASAEPNEMDACELREGYFDLQDLVIHARDEIKFLVDEYLHAVNCEPPSALH